VELRRAALALLGGVAIAASACSSVSHRATTQTTQPPSGYPSFAKDGTVTVAVPYLPTNFNPSTPAGANRVTQMVMEQVWPQAFVIDPLFQAETTGFIDSAEVVGLRPMTVSYQIDPEATWSDWYPITAADFIYNWHQQLRVDPQLPSAGYLAGYRDIQSISGSNGGKTVTVVFKRLYADWEGLFANLIPAHIARLAGWVAAFAGFHASSVISGGPFVVSALEPGKRLVLTRNATYWGPPAHLLRIVFVVARAESATLSGLQNGSISVAEVTPGSQVDRVLAGVASLDPALVATTSPSPVLWQLAFNLNDPVVGNQVMRKALAFATDPEELTADSINLADPLTVSATSRVFAQGQPGSLDEPASDLRYDPAEAAVLLKSLGYALNALGDFVASGLDTPLTLTVTGPRGSGVIDALELQLQAEWASSGIRMTIHNVPMSELLDKVLPEGTYQLALAPYTMPPLPSWNALLYTDPVRSPSSSDKPAIGANVADSSGGTASSGTGASGTWWWSVPTPEGTEPGGPAVGAVTRDITGLDDPRVGIRLEQIMSQLNQSRQEQLLSKLDALLTSDLPTLPLFQEPVTLVQRSDIVNVSESPGWAGPLWDAEDWAIQLVPPAG